MAKVEKKRGPGRPATGVTPKQYFRMPADEYAKVEQAATLTDDGNTSAFIRRVLLAAANRTLKQK